MWFLVFILGLAIGSFLNAYIWRLHESFDRGRISAAGATRDPTSSTSVWRGRSMCPKCKKTLQWFELIPLLSFIIQRGRCRGCKQKIDWQYPLVEFATGVLFMLGYLKIETLDNWNLIGNWKLEIGNLIQYGYFFSVLIILFVYDLRYGLVPDRVVLPAIVVALLFNIVMSQKLFSIFYFLFSVVIGAAFFAIQHYLSRGRWVGAGDIRFGALMGAMLGWPQVLIGLLISYLVGGVVAAMLLLAGQKKFGQTVPMGTFLAIGTVITLLWGDNLLRWYWPL